MTVQSEVLDHLPSELTSIDRWIAWRWNGDKKVPLGKVNDPATWARYDDARARAPQNGGVGIVLGDLGDGRRLGGVDLDACRDPETGELAAWARKIISAFASYSEISPSETGVKIFAFGAPQKLPGHVLPMPGERINGKAPQAEVYVGGRFFTVTGERLPDAPNEVRVVGQPWLRIIKRLEEAAESGHATRPTTGRNDALYRHLCGLRAKGWSEAAIRAAAFAENNNTESEFHANFAGGALPGRELETIIQQVMKKPTGKAAGDPLVLRSDAPTFVARAFGEAHGDTWHWRGDFYQWSGAWWRPLSDDDLKARLYTWLERAKVRVGDDDKTRHYRPDNGKIAKVIDALAGVRHLADAREAPFFTDPRTEDPSPADLLPFRNGVLDLRTFELRDADPRLFALHRVDGDYDPAAQAPTWDRFLHEVFADDKEAACIAAVNEFLGYVLTPDTSQQKALMLVGQRRSGKGTIARVLRALVGPDRYAGPTVAAFSNEFGLQQIIDKSVAVIADARTGKRADPHVLVERILSITGEDALGVNRKYKSHWQGMIPARLVYVSNELPRFIDASAAVVSRFIVVPFRRSFLGKEDPDLTRKLLAELPGIVNRALEGLKRMRARGRFDQPETGAEIIAELERNADPVRTFVEDECTLGAGYEVRTEVLYNAYSEWAGQNGHTKPGSGNFGVKLTAAYPEIQTRKPSASEDPARKRIYVGITLRGEAQAAMTPKHASLFEGQGDHCPF
jgi:putative DNA primase/helicase